MADENIQPKSATGTGIFGSDGTHYSSAPCPPVLNTFIVNTRTPANTIFTVNGVNTPLPYTITLANLADTILLRRTHQVGSQTTFVETSGVLSFNGVPAIPPTGTSYNQFNFTGPIGGIITVSKLNFFPNPVVNPGSDTCAINLGALLPLFNLQVIA